MRESCKYGSVRGAPSNGRPYRDRREFITLLGGATAWPIAARAQQRERMRRIGVLLPAAANDARLQTFLAAFHQGLGLLGWTVGRNVRIDTRWAAGHAEIRQHVQELVSVPQQIARCSVPGKGLGHLARKPILCGIWRDLKVENPSAIKT
jgi:hypothetical protein